MPSAKSNVNVNDEQLAEALTAHAAVTIELPVDENGNIFIDKNQYPELYDWAVNEI
jgi:hypothetical protein